MMIRAVLALACLTLTLPAAAQERTPGKAVTVTFVKFKPGAAERIDEIESKYFDPAAEKFGIRPVIIRMASGQWDREYIFPMKGGMAELDYTTTKEQVAWLAEVDRLAGGAGMAKKLLAEWNSLIDRQTNEFGFSDQK